MAITVQGTGATDFTEPCGARGHTTQQSSGSGHILRAVFVPVCNPAPSRFSNEDIGLLEIQYLACPGPCSYFLIQPGVNPKEKGSGLCSLALPPLPSDVRVKQLQPREGRDLLRVTSC